MAKNSNIDMNRGKAGLLALVGLAASLLIGVQLYLIALKGETACFNEGCAIVEGLTRISPFLFNLFGLFFFLAVILAAVLVVIRPAAGPFPSLLLLAAMVAEGVLLAYQYHVARAWCSYCLIIFGLVALCNLIVGLRQLLNGMVLVAAVNIIFALLRFEPAILSSPEGALAMGTAAIRPGPEKVGAVTLIYAKDCPHCMTLLQKLPEFTGCAIRLNPIDEQPPADIQGLDRLPSFQPEMNRLLLRMLKIDTVPLLIAQDNGGFRIIRSGADIEAYLSAKCAEGFAYQAPADDSSKPESGGMTDGRSFFPLPGDEECQVDVKCPEPKTTPAE